MHYLSKFTILENGCFVCRFSQLFFENFYSYSLFLRIWVGERLFACVFSFLWYWWSCSAATVLLHVCCGIEDAGTTCEHCVHVIVTEYLLVSMTCGVCEVHVLTSILLLFKFFDPCHWFDLDNQTRPVCPNAGKLKGKSEYVEYVLSNFHPH